MSLPFAADIDYSLPHSMVLIFDETTSLSCLYIEVTDDLVFELPEQFTLQLYTSTASVVLSPDTATVNIADNDSKSSTHIYMYTANYVLAIVVTNNHDIVLTDIINVNTMMKSTW